MDRTTVLVVDDDKALRELCLEVVKQLGFEALVAEDAARALPARIN